MSWDSTVDKAGKYVWRDFVMGEIAEIWENRALNPEDSDEFEGLGSGQSISKEDTHLKKYC